MISIRFVCVFLVSTICMGGAVFAGSETLEATADCMITEHVGLGGKDSNHEEGHLGVIKAIVGMHRTVSIVKFDLSAFEGLSLEGDTVAFRLTLRTSWKGKRFAHKIGVRECLVTWDEKTVTWNKLGGTGYDERHFGKELTARNVTFSGKEAVITFTLPVELVQKWMDHPESNNGIALFSHEKEICKDMSFYSRESGPAPQLVIDLSDEELEYSGRLPR